MRFTFLNLLAIAAIVLLAAFIFTSRNKETVIISDYGDIWEFQESVAIASRWIDKTKPPPLAGHDVYQIAERLCSHLDAFREKTGCDHWQTAGLSIERLLLLDEHSWAYIVRLDSQRFPSGNGQWRVQELTALILMDTTVLFDSGRCSPAISAAMLEFDAIDAAPSEKTRKQAMAKFGGGFF